MNKPEKENEFVAAEAPQKPPRARVSDVVDTEPEAETAGEKLERKRDYLEGFLQKKPEGDAVGGAGRSISMTLA